MTDDSKPTVLNVNDNEFSRRVLNHILNSAGFEVLEASSGMEALQRVKERPDLVLLDVQLPDIDGFEVCRKMKADPISSLVPVLHLSATFQDDKARAAGMESGADGYLTFPVEPLVLTSSIRALLRLRTAKQDALVAARQWQSTFDAIGDGICLLDADGKAVRCNRAVETIIGKPADQILGCTCSELMQACGASAEESPFQRVLQSRQRETITLPLDGRWFSLVIDPIRDEAGNLVGAVQIISDITERKEAAEEQERLVRELKDALAQVKTLKGFLPICASCKGIRDDEGYWHRVEKYIGDHAGVKFSHGLCPDCAQKLYPDYYGDDK